MAAATAAVAAAAAAPAAPKITYADGAVNGVAFQPPPADLMPSINAAISAAVATLPEGKSGGLVALYSVNPDGTRNANAALIQKFDTGPFDFRVMGFVGKTWPKEQATGFNGWRYGAAFQMTW